MGATDVGDGRRQRSERSRAAVIDALLACYDEGTVSPSGAEIAARAGVSERSVFRHFEDLDALANEAFERQFARVAPFFAPPPADGTRTERIAALVEQRSRLHERMANLSRAATHHAARSATIARRVRERQAFLRAQVERQFATELDVLASKDRRLLLAALDGAVGMEGVAYLRTAADVGPRDLRVVLARTLSALLATTDLQELP
ncbi:TetR/AcrR family transcriptional regulator [Aquihabitans sp. G128]|uniref:TetR/AcrR family transcriptional regulator n=1 Tax=Aquihabitans sp. G128 TaxID=2849779 RepID=UPI001C246C34|nr:TetR/AcrR family transcriptional regulator [Aquihabitans sp. G128]QXC61155.1 TetR/AcrR family transcriptional regulator [Aquihabitans sp. G128]